jgi:hypothetical protein
MNERETIDEFEAKFQALGDEAKAAGIDWIVALVYDDPYEEASLSTVIHRMPVYTRMGIAKMIEKYALDNRTS